MDRAATGHRHSADAGTATNATAVTVAGVAGLVVTKAADVTTTVVGLRASEALTERNPLANAAIAEYGALPGLIALGTFTVLLIVCVVEGTFRLSARADDIAGASSTTARRGRVVCYGAGCVCNVAFAVNNALLIVSVPGG